jgi:tetrahydromethanopterin S-methyltransferase subunit G
LYFIFEPGHLANLTEEEIEELVEKVSARVIDNFYKSVGRSVVSRFLWLIGLVTVALLGWLGITGKTP